MLQRFGNIFLQSNGIGWLSYQPKGDWASNGAPASSALTEVRRPKARLTHLGLMAPLHSESELK
jgi:hypothetical protein